MSGYMCKQCGAPSPVGVGYVDTRPGAAQASEQLEACACGHSRTPGNQPDTGNTPHIAH